MRMRTRSGGPRTRLGLAAGAILAAMALVACGSSSGSGASSTADAQSVVARTFSGAHAVRSGVLHLTLTVNPSGSSRLTTPLGLTLTGPFQSRGAGRLPESDFTIALGALGNHGSLRVISTGTQGYVTLQGTSYRLPAADFKRLESGLPAARSASRRQVGLAGLGINPQDWLKDPSVVGSETVAGVPTTHIRAGVDVARLLANLNTFLANSAKASGATTVPSSIPPATADKLGAAVRKATVDLWTGANDMTLRRLTLTLTAPAGATAKTLGGRNGAQIGLTVQYSQLDQPQVIVAPPAVHPYSELAGKLQGLASALPGVGSAASTSQASAPSPGAVTSAASRYTECIAQAGDDVARMQKCAPLLHRA